MPRPVLTILACVLVCGAAGCGPAPPPREIGLIARGMTFVLADQPDSPNPVIPLRAGERVTVVLRNEAPGLLHDFAIPEWDVQSDQIRAGQSAAVTFTVPSTPGRSKYLCLPHGEMMNGFVEVTP